MNARMAWRRSPNSQALHSESQLWRSLGHRPWRTLRVLVLKSEFGQTLSGEAASGKNCENPAFCSAFARPNVDAIGTLEQRGESRMWAGR